MGQRQMKVTPVLLLLGYVAPTLGGVLYPFGPQVGDTATPREDDGMSPEISLWEPFPFYGHAHRTLYVNNNGVVSFGAGVPEFTPEPFPVAQRPLLAPFWADVDTSLGGAVWYRQSREPALLARLTRDIGAVVPSPGPPPTWALVATWDRVTFFGAAIKKVNTFQAVLATNGVTSFVMFNYGNISWTTGIANQGNPHTGLGGTPAQAGFNSGDPAHYAVLPGSRSPHVPNIARGSNVGVPGRWIFRVEGDVITPGPPDVPVDDVTPDDVTGDTPDDVTQAPPNHSTQERVYVCHWCVPPPFLFCPLLLGEVVKGHMMAGGALGVLVLLAVLSPARGDPPTVATSNFQYDWHRLRVAGLVVAAVLCVTGVIVLISGTCKCQRKRSHHRPPPEMSNLKPGAASSC